MNVELLLKVKEAILADPKTYDQENWCGTACCIAGHAVAIAQPSLYLGARDGMGGGAAIVYDAANLALDLYGYEFDKLCASGDNWPEPFASEYCEADAAGDAGQRAAVAARRIDHFIATDGRE